jgi:DNA-directed RNA polymerase subunit beta'
MEISPQAAFDTLKDNVVRSISAHFPHEGRLQKVVLKNIWVDDKLDVGDLTSQADAKDHDRTWGVPIKADLALVDKRTGQEIDRHTMTVAKLPKMTPRLGFIVDGNEYQVDTLFRLKSGVYARVQQNGDLRSEFNLASGNSFPITFDRKKQQFLLRQGSSNIPVYPILRALGVQDDELERAWTKEILESNRPKDPKSYVKALSTFFEKTSYEDQKTPTDLGALNEHVKAYFDKTQLRPDTTAITLGKPFEKVTGEVIRLATAKLLGLSRGTHQADDRDSLAFKEVVSVEDFIPQKIDRAERSIKGKMRINIDSKKSVLEIVSPDLFRRPIDEFFKKGGSITERSEQNNPLQMLAAHHKTTLMAPEFGGMKKEHTITNEMRIINPSHFGFLDPMHTPESERTGITLHLSMGAKKKGRDLITTVYDLKEKKLVQLNATDFHNAGVIMADQVRWVNGHPKPIFDVVKIKKPGGDIEPEEYKTQTVARYVMPSAKDTFGIVSNLIPFLPTDQGNRVSMADKQMEQAISLKHRQAPLVQSKSDSEKTFEEIVGHLTATTSPVAGKVVDVKKNHIVISDGRKKHTVHLYDNFPLNNPVAMMHSTPVVKVGDEVKPGQLLADTNYTDKGRLALGANLRIGYMPYKGYNFEDGIVVSETASKKLTSEHLHRKSMDIDPEVDRLGKSAWLSHASLTSQSVPKAYIDALDEEGVIRLGTKVMPGQVLVAALHKNTGSRMKEMSKRSSLPWRNNAMIWDEDHVGEVIKVVKGPTGRDIKVYVRTEQPLVVGDKLSGRHGNKGIVTMILPDHEMPYTVDKDTGDKRPLEVILNPSGVPTRINTGQMMETAAGKIAEKTGKPYVVDNFSHPNHNYRMQVVEDLHKHGLTDEEPVYDPKDPRRPLGSVLVGPQHILKLKHTVEDKLSVRGGGTDLQGRKLPIDVDRQPTRGSGNSGQSLGALDFYVLLGHNARHQLMESATYRSDWQDQSFWSMIQQGHEPPPPKAPFAYEKFMALLKGMGINVEKVGTKLRLQPMTDKEVLQLAGGRSGEIKNAHLTLRAKDLREEKHGLFDPAVTGGRNGTRWAFIKLHEAMPNPIFVGSGNQKGPIPTLLGLNINEVEKVMQGTMEINGKTGGKAIEEALRKIDVDKEIAATRERFKTVKRGMDLDRENKKLKYLLALKETGYAPHEAYIMHYLPVLPPVFRPVTETHTGDLHYNPLNGLYKNLAILNQKVSEFDPKIHLPEWQAQTRHAMYESLKALQAIGGSVGYDTDSPGGRRKLKGILSTIGGGVREGGEKEQPKEGYFQSHLVKRRQNLSIRSTITPEPKMGLDEVGLPRNAAMELYKPYVVAELGKMHIPPLEAQEYMKKGTDFAWKALERVVAERPMLIKRDPALHKFSILAFRPKLIEGKAIQIHPLVTGGFNADFDGDTMSGYIPMSREAVEEAKKMFPSRNLFSPTTGKVPYTPSQEAMLGLHLISEWGKKSSKKFKTTKEAERAYSKQEIELTDVIHLEGAKGPTTYGRLLIADKLPGGKIVEQILHDPEFVINKKRMQEITRVLASDHPRDFSEAVDHLKDLGNEHSFKAGYSFGLKDLATLPQRDKIIEDARKEETKVRKSIKDKSELHSKIIDIWQAATDKLDKAAEEHYKDGHNRLAKMIYSGARGSKEQLRQMVAAPMLMQDGTGRKLSTPVTRSYAEGLDLADYWMAQHGARKGTLQRALGTEKPGVISKDIINATMSTLIVSPDCKTTQGVLMRLTPPKDDRDHDHTSDDVHDRFLATGYKLSDGSHVKAGTLLTPEIMGRLKNAGHEKVLVRSPLKCQHGDGICAKCFGLNENGRSHEVGTNIGVLAGQAMSEPAVQMAMDAFHTGGLATGRGAESVDKFTRLNQLLKMPQKLKNSAVLARATGRITDIKKDAAGGYDIFINGERHLVPYPGKLLPHVQVGADMEKSKPLSEGPINPHHLLPLTDMHRVQKHLTEELYNSLYRDQGVRRRNIEVVVRNLTNLTKVKDPGHSEYVPGDVIPRSVIEEHNRSLPKSKKPVLHEPVLHGLVEVSSGAGSTDWMSLLNYQRLTRTLTKGTAQGWKSDLHGSNPVPGYAHGSEFGKPPPGSPKHVY